MKQELKALTVDDLKEQLALIQQEQIELEGQLSVIRARLRTNVIKQRRIQTIIQTHNEKVESSNDK